MGLHFDATMWRLLKLLQENARLSFRQIGEAIGLTAPAVTERVRRLEDAGVIKGYRAEVDLPSLGLPITAFVHLTSNSPQSLAFRKAVLDMPEVVESHCVTGIESYILKVSCTSVPHLERFLMKLKDYGDMRTSLVLSTQVSHRVIDEWTVNPDEEERLRPKRG